MKLNEIIARDAIVPSLVGTEREDVIRELIGALVQAGAVSREMEEEILESVLQRERKGSTGFGKGVAIPHVKHPSVKELTAAIGISQQGIEFSALDRQPVYSVFLLMSPADDPEAHLRAMEVIFKNLSQDNFRRFLRQSTSVEDVWTLLEDADNQTLHR